MKGAASAAMNEDGGDACPPVEDVSAAGQILDLAAHGHDECLSSPEGLSIALDRRGHHLCYSSEHQVANDAKTISGTTGKSRN